MSEAKPYCIRCLKYLKNRDNYVGIRYTDKFNYYLCDKHTFRAMGNRIYNKFKSFKGIKEKEHICCRCMGYLEENDIILKANGYIFSLCEDCYDRTIKKKRFVKYTNFYNWILKIKGKYFNWKKKRKISWLKWKYKTRYYTIPRYKDWYHRWHLDSWKYLVYPIYCLIQVIKQQKIIDECQMQYGQMKFKDYRVFVYGIYEEFPNLFIQKKSNIDNLIVNLTKK